MFFNKKEKPYIIPPSYFRNKEDKQEKPKDKEDGKSSI